MNSTVEWVKGLPFSITWWISIFWYEVVLIYIGLILLVFSFTLKKNKLLVMFLFTCVLVLSSLIIKSNSIETTKEIVVYNIKDEVAIDVFYGDKNLFLSSDDLIKNEDKLLFNVKHYWFYKTGEEQPEIWKDISIFNNSVLNFDSLTLSVASKESCFMQTNYVIVTDVVNVSDSVLDNWKRHKSVLILHPSIKYWVKSKIMKEYPELLVFNMKEKGAFTFSF